MLTVPSLPVTLYLIPADATDALAALIRTIDSATETIDAELFQLSHPAVIAALAQAHARNVRLRLLLEHSEASTPDGVTALHSLITQGVPAACIQITTSEIDHAFAHKKVLIIDGLITVDGSTNMSASAFKERNHLLFLTSPAYAAAVTASFVTHWQWTAANETRYQAELA